MKQTLLLNPGIVNIFLIRLLRRGTIYIDGGSNRYNKYLIKKVYPILLFFNITYFEYKLGLGDLSNAVVSSYCKEAASFAEKFLKESGNEPLLIHYNKIFKTKAFSVVWKKMVSQKILFLFHIFNGLVQNYSSPFTVYLYKNSKESLVANSFFAKYPSFKLDLKYYQISFMAIETIILHFLWIIYKTLKNGLQVQPISQKNFRIILEAVNPYLDKNRSFSILEWWNEKLINKKDILFFSYGSNEIGRMKGIKKAHEMGFQCETFNRLGKLPLSEFKAMVNICVFLPLKNLLLLIKSQEIEFFLKALRDFHEWHRFYSYYNIDFYILPSSGESNIETIIANYFGTKTIAISFSYHGSLDLPSAKYMNANYFITWGEGQTSYIPNNLGVENFLYVGCYAMSYYSKQKKHYLSSQSDSTDMNKKSIVFFDNKVIKNYETPESLCFRYYDLILKVAGQMNVNVFYRSKASNPFDRKFYNDPERAESYEKKMKDRGVFVVNRDTCDVMTVINGADIVVYNRVGTPSMVALLLDIPTLSFYDNVAETPDPIMKHYVDELVFEDEAKILDKIKKILNKESLPHLTAEHKKLLNHHMDHNGLERFQTLMANLVY